jgi:hypothetical protein
MGDTVVATTVPKYESRWAVPFVGYLGYFFYVWELFVILGVMCTMIDVWNNAPWLFISVLIVNIVLAFGFWMFTGFYFMPYYATRPSKKFIAEPGQLPEITMEREERSYAGKVREDLKAHNDQEHFQNVLFRSIVILIFLGVFLGTRGVVSFQPLATGFTEVEITNYVISKFFQMMILACAAASYMRLGETHSDLIWRHMTAENTQYREKNGGENKALGQSYNGNATQRRNGTSLMNGSGR